MSRTRYERAKLDDFIFGWFNDKYPSEMTEAITLFDVIGTV